MTESQTDGSVRWSSPGNRAASLPAGFDAPEPTDRDRVTRATATAGAPPPPSSVLAFTDPATDRVLRSPTGWNPVLRTLLLERLSRELDAEARARDRGRLRRGRGAGDRRAPPVWLSSVTVEGFRGIGAPATLALEPRPGLTVVVGRNGSGKSSFAEGLELLMTGALKRWEKRPKAWTETWQCLHHDGPTRLAGGARAGGPASGVTLAQEWPHGAGTATRAAAPRPPRCSPSTAGTATCRRSGPFLAYAELATMFDTLSLALRRAHAGARPRRPRRARAARSARPGCAYDNQRKAVAAARDALVARLDPDDERAALVAAALGARKPDLDALAAAAARTRPTTATTPRSCAGSPGLALPADEEIREAFQALRVAERAHKDAAQTDARARDQRRRAAAPRARRPRPGAATDDCPVCGTPDVLDDAWAASATEQAAALEEQAAALTRAERELAAARRRVDALLDATPAPPRRSRAGRPATRRTIAAPRAIDAPTRARGRALRALSDGAGAELAAPRRGLAGARRPTSRRWLEQAREVEARARHAEGAQGRREVGQGRGRGRCARERFAPISERAIANWRELRQGSSVDLHEITLKKVGRGGRADFDVRADGEGANALGVMSQGELLALLGQRLPAARGARRVAVPLRGDRRPGAGDGPGEGRRPRARPAPRRAHAPDRRLHPRRPAARGDPPAAAGRDDAARRPPRALERRRPGRRAARSSATSTARAATPSRDRLPPEVQARVVPMFCRSAVEAAAANIVRRRAVEHGTDLDEADEQLAEARTLRETLALVLFGEAGPPGRGRRRGPRRYGGAAAGARRPSSTAAPTATVLDPPTLERLPESTRDFIHAADAR